jgi:hypothetical protein
MLDWVHSSVAAANERKLRLFAVACCSGCFSYRLLDPRSKTAVDLAARLVEGQADAAEVARAAFAAGEVDEARHGIACNAYDDLAAEVANLTSAQLLPVTGMNSCGKPTSWANSPARYHSGP